MAAGSTQLDVVAVRRALASIRVAWARNSPEEPFLLGTQLATGDAADDFCFAFVRQQHTRRR